MPEYKMSAPQNRRQISTPAAHRANLLGYGACALAGTLWGTGFFWGRLALDEMSVEHMVLYRFFLRIARYLSGGFGAPCGFYAHEFRLLLLAAAFGVPIQFLLQFHGLTSPP